jgi:hypothetical protein
VVRIALPYIALPYVLPWYILPCHIYVQPVNISFSCLVASTAFSCKKFVDYYCPLSRPLPVLKIYEPVLASILNRFRPARHDRRLHHRATSLPGLCLPVKLYVLIDFGFKDTKKAATSDWLG